MIMGSSFCIFMSMRLLFSFSLFLFLLTDSFSSLQPLCHEDESSALLQFKESFTINKSASMDPLSYPKVASWKLEEGDSTSDCCSWDGVECDKHTGHVIGLDLSSSCLFGSINSNSTLFRLLHLQKLNLADNHFNYSHIPSTVGNLSALTSLNLSYSVFSRQIPSEISQLSKLSVLDLSTDDYYLYTESSRSLVHNLTSLEQLFLSYVNISSSIPQILANFSSLKALDLFSCGLYGEFPTKIFHLPNLQYLSVGLNQKLTGHFPEFHSSNPLKILALDETGFFGKLPASIGNLNSLHVLSVWNCNISGPIPSSLGNLTQLTSLDLSNNNLSGTVEIEVFLKHKNFDVLLLSFNKLSLLINKTSSNATLPQFQALGLASCNLSQFPDFLGNQHRLSWLDLSFNNLQGTISDTWERGSSLKMINLGENKLEGQLPRSLANCKMLEFLNVGNNQINDTFPFWLGNLSQLKVLALHSNGFYGAIRSPKKNYMFPKLRIIDLSHNCFSGKLPSEYFLHWNAMKVVDANQLTYMNVSFLKGRSFLFFDYSVTITNKGISLEYNKIQDFFMVIDFSRNEFEGEIPQVIGNLKALNLLNLSNNVLTGHIPLSLENLAKLESLDLSQNKLSGEIPPQLIQLTFLEVFNVSHNYLEGPIPHGKQFDTFSNTSFEGNSGLCGSPLSKKCGNSKDSPPSPSTFEENQGSESPFEFGWKVVMIGYGCGLIVGVVIGQIVVTRKQDWFMKTFAIGQQKRRSVNMRGHRN